jgi:hypothetical protein
MFLLEDIVFIVELYGKRTDDCSECKKMQSANRRERMYK